LGTLAGDVGVEGVVFVGLKPDLQSYRYEEVWCSGYATYITQHETIKITK
jgi:hypothetical protein